MNDCLFCAIAKKEKPSYVIYEDDTVLAFLDIFPHAPGHTLVIPRRHIKTLLEMDSDEIKPFWLGVHATLKVLQETMHAHGFTVGINHGKVSGQAVEHLHVHCMPRYEGDGGGSIHSVIKNPGPKSVEEIYKEIQQKIKN